MMPYPANTRPRLFTFFKGLRGRKEKKNDALIGWLGLLTALPLGKGKKTKGFIGLAKGK